MQEYRDLRSKVSFLELCRSPELCAEVTLQPIDKLDVDAAILFSDILVVFDALGVGVEFNPGPVVASPIRTREQAQKLRWPSDLHEIEYVFQAVRACKRALSDRVPLIGFCGAPLTVLSYLIEGGGSRDFEHTKRMAFSEPALFAELMEKMAGLLGDYLLAQLDAGADAVQIFDSWAAALGPRDYRAMVLPALKVLVATARSRGKPVILFARGNAEHLQAVSECGADVVGVDWSMEIDRASELLGHGRVLQGNLDPMLLLGEPQRLIERSFAMLEQARLAPGHIANLGHGVSRWTDPEMARLFVESVHHWRPGAAAPTLAELEASCGRAFEFGADHKAGGVAGAPAQERA